RRGAAAIEVTLHRNVAADRWRVFARPARKLRTGDRLDFHGLSATVAEKGEGGEVELAFDRTGPDLMAALQQFGHVPLPPSIRRAGGAEARARPAHQPIYAAPGGAAAAPPAGLHFTPELLAALAARGIGRAMVTLHVGAGTFLPVKVED